MESFYVKENFEGLTAGGELDGQPTLQTRGMRRQDLKATGPKDHSIRPLDIFFNLERIAE